MQRLRKGLYLLESGGWVNAYLLEGPRGLTLVDTGHSRSADKLVAEITGSGFELKEIEQILITHGHFDHAGGAAFLMDRHRVKIFAHPADALVLQGKVPPPPVGSSRWLLGLIQRLWFPYRPLEVVVALRQSETLRALPNWQVLHTPGHTPGSVSLYQPSDYLLICGDAFWNRRGELGLPPKICNDDSALAAQSAKKLAALPCEVLCCGHGPVIRSGAGIRLNALADRL